jgi:hypothetical protein
MSHTGALFAEGSNIVVTGGAAHEQAATKLPDEVVKRVSFCDPTAPRTILYPGYESAWDAPLCWTLLVVAYVIRFYRLGVPSSVVFDE